MLYLLQMGSSKVLTSIPLQTQNSWQLSLLKLPPCCVPTHNTVTSSYDLYTILYNLPPSAYAALPPRTRLQTSYPPSSGFVSSASAPSPLPLVSGCPSMPPTFSPLILSGFFNGMLRVSEPGALNCFNFFTPIPLTLFVSRNPILTHLPPSRFLDSLLCVLIAPTPGLAFTLLMPPTLAAALSFLSARAYHFLMCTLTPNRSSSSDGRTDSFSPSILPSSRNLFILGDFNCHHLLWDSKGDSDPRREKVFDWVISSDLLPLNDSDTPNLLHRSSGSRSVPDISFALFSLALSCSWEVLQELGSDHLPSLLSVPLSALFRPNERPPSFNFQKAHWDDFAFYLDSHYPSAEEYSFLSLSSAAVLYTSLALNAAIPFGRIKRHPKAWWSAEVESAVNERRKAIAAAHRSDEDGQTYISTSRRTSSVIAKAKAEAWQANCSSLSFKSNPKTVYSLFRTVASSSSSSSSSPNFPNCSSLRVSPSVYADYLRSHFSVSQPKALRSRAIFLSFAEPRALWSLTRPFAPLLS